MYLYFKHCFIKYSSKLLLRLKKICSKFSLKEKKSKLIMKNIFMHTYNMCMCLFNINISRQILFKSCY